MTESVVALPSGTAVGDSDRARARRARTRASVDATDRSRKAREVAARTGLGIRRFGRVMYADVEGSWIVRDATPSISQLWKTDYPAIASIDYAPFRIWCRAYRYPAVAFAAVLDSAKWALIHPVRGPLFITTVGAGITAAIH